MSSRKIRRMQAHVARKAARKAGFPPAQPEPSTLDAAVASLPVETKPEETETFFLARMPEPGFPFPSLAGMSPGPSPARLAANAENAKKSTGPKSPETKATSAQNHTIHGLARHQNSNFKILNSEDAGAFQALHDSLIAEHAPATTTESILVTTMAQSQWLALRAQRLQDIFIDADTGLITDEKKFSLYARYQTTHTRAFHKCLNDLLKLRAEKRKSEIGFEAQRRESEKHELRKQTHYWEVLKKDALACQELSKLAALNFNAGRENPGFEAQYEAELTKRGLEMNAWQAASHAA